MIEVEFFNHARLIYWKRDNGYKIASTFAGAGVLMSVENIRRAQQNCSTGHVKWPHVFSFFFFCVKFNLGLAWMGKKKIQSLITYLNIVKIFSKVFALWSKLKSIRVQKKKNLKSIIFVSQLFFYQHLCHSIKKRYWATLNYYYGIINVITFVSASLIIKSYY